ncbi:MAG: 5-oxoprolinase subunit PxpA [Nitrospira sp. CR2.1]|nr:5-oxoprolinase subunit PxpA [Nitrospira sp. CR2.1]
MTQRRRIDVNCDLGEAATPRQLQVEARLMTLVTSVNVACGVHAGDATLMRHTVRMAHRHNLAVGAHPGLPDRESKGRREQSFSPAFVQELIRSQVGDLMSISQSEGVRLSHVKPHGALYNIAARDRLIADAIATALLQLDHGLILVGLADSELIAAGSANGLRVAAEGFADRGYRADGSLVPRGQAGAILHDEAAVVARARSLVTVERIAAIDGTVLHPRIHTLCLHGDTPDAVSLAQALRVMFDEAGISVIRVDHVA